MISSLLPNSSWELSSRFSVQKKFSFECFINGNTHALTCTSSKCTASIHPQKEHTVLTPFVSIPKSLPCACLICLSVGGHWDVSTSWLVWVDLLWTLVYKYLSTHFQFFMLYIHGSGTAMSYVTCLPFWGIIKLFSTVLVPVYLPVNNVQGYQFLHIFASTCYLPFFRGGTNV